MPRPETAAVDLACAECRRSPRPGEVWRLFFADVGEAVTYCPECAERKFGAAPEAQAIELYDYDGIPVSVADDRATAWDVPEGRPFPLESVLDARQLTREQFEALRRLNLGGPST